MDDCLMTVRGWIAWRAGLDPEQAVCRFRRDIEFIGLPSRYFMVHPAEAADEALDLANDQHWEEVVALEG